MIRPERFLGCAVVLGLAPVLLGQVTLNPNPGTVLGHPQLELKNANPNLVEGRELYGPSSVAIDTSATPPIVYVADTGNNRVLAWRYDPSRFVAGQLPPVADVVIGQKDPYSTFPQGPGLELNSGLRAPTGVAVDAYGNLFVADALNNRILRYTRPFADPQQVKQPDLVIGQATLGTRTTSNPPTDSSLSLNNGSLPYTVPLFFDPAGNLFVADAGNKRVLRFKAADVAPGAKPNRPSADLVLGQPDFTSTPRNPSSINDLSRLAIPAGIAMDPAGRLYVCDVYRVLVYLPAFSSGGAATRMIGGLVNAQGGAVQPPDGRTLNNPNGIFFVGDRPYVVDTGNDRILRFKRYEDWPVDLSTPPTADGLIGQASYSDDKANRGQPQPQFGTPDNPAVSFAQPAAGVVTDELFVADTANHRVVVASIPAVTSTGADTATKRVLGQQFLDTNAANLVEGREFFFGGGTGVVVDTRSNPPRLYVADTVNNRVLGFRDARSVRPGDKADLVIGQPELVRTIANYPNNSATEPTSKSLYGPTGLALDSSGNLYVADTGNGRVLRFPKPFDRGNYPDADLVLGKASFTTALDPAADPGTANTNGPYGLALTTGGHLLVSDLLFNRVLLFRKPTGGDFANGMAADAVIGQPDFFSRGASSESKRMRNPRHIGVDSSDRLFVCDTGNNRILAYDSITSAPLDPTPAFPLTALDQSGTRLNAPQGIYVSPVTGEIWVADTGARYILRYPTFNTLIVSPLPNFAITTSTTVDERALALTVDGFGNLLTALSTNRIGFYFAASSPVNTANGLTRFTPGMSASLYTMGDERVYGDQTTSATSLPLPTELADIQVLVNDQPAPLWMVSPGQINFQMPMSTPSSGSVQVKVVRKSLNQILAVGCAATNTSSKPLPPRFVSCSGQVQMDVASPALFAGPTKYEGTGQIAAYNVRASDGSSYGVNSASNPVARSDYIVLYGTGQGFIPNAPPDGAAPGGIYWTPGSKPQVIVNTAFVGDDNVTFSGLSPQFPGLWQLNVKIPDTTPPSSATGGATLLVLVHRGIPSNDTTSPGRIVTTIQVKQ